jgi:hypothetical protein
MLYPLWNIHRLNRRRQEPECCCGRKSWTIEVAASKVKAAVKRQLADVQDQLDRIESERRAIDAKIGNAPPASSKEFSKHCEDNRNEIMLLSGLFMREYAIKPDLERWQKWDAFLASMPDDEMLELTRDDHELFFYGREIDAV